MKAPEMSPDTIAFEIHDRSQMETTLQSAVEALSDQAKSLRQGILVTRTAPQTFIVSLNSQVPYGTTQERTTW